MAEESLPGKQAKKSESKKAKLVYDAVTTAPGDAKWNPSALWGYVAAPTTATTLSGIFKLICLAGLFEARFEDHDAFNDRKAWSQLMEAVRKCGSGPAEMHPCIFTAEEIENISENNRQLFRILSCTHQLTKQMLCSGAGGSWTRMKHFR